MNFNSKETYLAARKQWANNYNALSADIRSTRGAYTEACRAASKHKYDWKAGQDEEKRAANRAYCDAYGVVENVRGELAKLRKQANEALTERQDAKEEAHRQWLAAKEARSPAS